jgi:cytochrome d ubiquinol oxidase subunit I
VVIPFFTFRIMVGCGLIMLFLAWYGSYSAIKNRVMQNRLLLFGIFLSFPLPFVAILTGWYTAEVGRQPWVVYGVLRTADAMTPFLTARSVSITLALFGVVYLFIFLFGMFYIYRLLRAGPAAHIKHAPYDPAPNRPISIGDETPVSRRAYVGAGE